MTNQPTPNRVNVKDTDVHALVGFSDRDAVLAYAPGLNLASNPGSDWAVMPEAVAVAEDWHTVARVADVLARFGPAPLDDDAAHAAAHAINAGTLHAWPSGMHEATCGRCGETFNPSGPDDLEHIARADGSDCGGRGRYAGTWR